MSETVESRLGALSKKQGHPGSINVADVGHMMQSWKKTKADLERQLTEERRVSDGLHTAVLLGSKEQERLERQLADARGKLRRFTPFLKRLIEATKPYHENRDEPEAAETLFNIYEDAVVVRALAITPEGEKEKHEHID